MKHEAILLLEGHMTPRSATVQILSVVGTLWFLIVPVLMCPIISDELVPNLRLSFENLDSTPSHAPSLRYEKIPVLILTVDKVLRAPLAGGTEISTYSSRTFSFNPDCLVLRC